MFKSVKRVVALTAALVLLLATAAAETQSATFTLEVQPKPTEVAMGTLRMALPLLSDGETGIALYAQPDSASDVLAEIGGAQMLGIQEIGDVWTLAVAGERQGYVLTSKLALYNGETQPEEEEIIRTITVSTSVGANTVLHAGDAITLTARLSGFEKDVYTLQWQYTPDGGATVVDVEGANKPTFTYTVNDQNATFLWRIQVQLQNAVPGENEAPDTAK